MPGIGLTSPTDSHAGRSAARDASRPWSVIATAPWPSADAACTSRVTEDRPSKSEYSEWVWRWTNPALLTKAPFRKTSCQGDSGRRSAPVGRHRQPGRRDGALRRVKRSEEHTSELQSRGHLVCRLLLEQKNLTWHR